MQGQKIQRFGRVTKVLVREGLGLVAHRLGLIKETEQGVPSHPAQRLRMAMEELGPLFVKFGQLLSTREDLLPKEYCDEFSRLQSNVAAFDTAIAREIIETELGKPIEELFDDFVDTPLAAASLAQVHTARLKSGEDVVLKVQRPAASEQMLSDTELLLWFSRQLDRFLPPYRANRIHAMAEEFCRTSLIELNFLHEAGVAERFRANFALQPNVYIPQMYRQYSTGKVLTIERIHGTKLDSIQTAEQLEALGVAPLDLIKRLFKLVLQQAYVHGLIHADLHPGNMFLLPDGRVALIDFGLYGELSRSMQNALFRTVLYRIHGKHEELAESILEVMEPQENANQAAFKKEIIRLNKQLLSSNIAEYSTARSFQDESKAAMMYGYVAPDEIMMLCRALVTVEGVAIRLRPDLQAAEYIQPIVREITLERFDLERVAKEGLLIIPDILEMIELAPAFHRNLLKIERAFAKSANLSEFMSKQLPVPSSHVQRRRGIGPFFLAAVLWCISFYAIHQQPNPVATLGDLSLVSGLLLLAAVLTTVQAMQR